MSRWQLNLKYYTNHCCKFTYFFAQKCIYSWLQKIAVIFFPKSCSPTPKGWLLSVNDFLTSLNLLSTSGKILRNTVKKNFLRYQSELYQPAGLYFFSHSEITVIEHPVLQIWCDCWGESAICQARKLNETLPQTWTLCCVTSVQMNPDLVRSEKSSLRQVQIQITSLRAEKWN